MHQTPVAELIKRFESPERDAYQKPKEVINYLGDLQGKTIMDIGAGSGYFSIPLAEKAQKVIAADVNQEFLDHINKRVKDNQSIMLKSEKFLLTVRHCSLKKSIWCLLSIPIIISITAVITFQKSNKA